MTTETTEPSDDKPPEPAPGPPADAADASEGTDRDPIGEGRAANDAYERGWNSLRSAGNFASATKSKFKNLIGGNYYHNEFPADTGDRKTSVPIRPSVLDRVRATFVPVAQFDPMIDTLRESRVVVLRGLPGSGMTTTAFRLLDEVTEGDVARLDLSGDIGSIRQKDLTKKRGYLVRLTSANANGGPTELELDALAELLGKRKCWCVITDSTGADQAPRGDYVREHHAPDNADVLRGHVAWRLGPDAADRVDDVLRVAENERIRQALGPHRTLTDVVALAGLLVEHERGTLELDDVVAGCTELVANQMATWFACLRHAASSTDKGSRDGLALAAFRIALAVFNESAYRQIVTAARTLEAYLVAELDPTASKKAPIWFDQRTALTLARATLWPGVISYGVDEVVKGDLVCYEDDRFPVAVLEHVWSAYDWLQAPMGRWLVELGQDDRSIIWVRAAQAVGALSAIDFDAALKELIWPHVFAETIRERRFAAVALDQASRDQHNRNAVAAFLRSWRRNGGEQARWTAATTLGYGQGLDDIDATLDALRVLGTPDEKLDALADPAGQSVMVTAVSRSLSSLLAFGAVEPILAALDEWLNHERASMRKLARAAIVRLVRQRGFDFTYLDISGGRDYRDQLPRHRRWPLLLALQHEDQSLVEPIARLVRTALRGNDGDRVTTAFRAWVIIAGTDATCLAALVEFLPRLVELRGDADRLLHLVTELRRDWAEPLRPDVANAIETAVRSANTREVHRWATATTS